MGRVLAEGDGAGNFTGIFVDDDGDAELAESRQHCGVEVRDAARLQLEGAARRRR